MCGIAGLSLATDQPAAPQVVRAMTDLIAHRGPDSSGYLASTNGTAHLGFRRLAIRDLNPRANQPMVSASGKTAIVFNGEIYNSLELADRYLADTQLRTTGDTEVVLEVLERQGISAIEQFNGMFAIAFVELKSGTTWLARDRMGMKPLYLFDKRRTIAFASELRCLKPFGLRPAPEVARLFLHFGYVPSPHTFFRHVTQVRPGEVVELHCGEVTSRHRFHDFTRQRWSYADFSAEQLGETFQDSVRLRKLSDVPLGAFLSGGIDSALVAAYASDGPSPTPTYTVAFRDRTHNEVDAAEDTARQLGLPHHAIDIAELELAELATDYLDCYEQPYADTSGLVTMLLCRAVKNEVTVALSGDGGDEFFGGYARYNWFRKALHLQRFPHLFRKLFAPAIHGIDQRRGPRLARWLDARDPAELYSEILRTWHATEVEALVDVPGTGTAIEPASLVRDVFARVDADPLSQAACFDASYYIPDDLQVKLDRASMRVALEVRCPLLDHRVAGIGLALNTESKYRDGLKTCLKDLLRQHVSADVISRPKQGFGVPLARWLAGPMKDMVTDVVKQRCVVESGWLKLTTAQRVVDDFFAGKTQYAQNVWMLMTLAHHMKSSIADPLFNSLLEPTQDSRANVAA